nr:MAG TPA: hypothetical protein [Caudoviricetes sp.]
MELTWRRYFDFRNTLIQTRLTAGFPVAVIPDRICLIFY